MLNFNFGAHKFQLIKPGPTSYANTISQHKVNKVVSVTKNITKMSFYNENYHIDQNTCYPNYPPRDR